MMNTQVRYENFPPAIVLVSALQAVLIYALGIYIIIQTGLLFGILFLVFLLAFEFRLIRYHCTDCYYYGKTCGFGRGRISSWFFKKGDPARFCKGEMKVSDLLPDMLVAFIPLVTGIVLLILDFRIWVLAAMLLIILLLSIGNAIVRGRLTCNYCKQKDLGCPADVLFNKKTEAAKKS